MTWLHKQGIYNMQACQTQLRLNQYEFGQDDVDAVYQDWLQTLGRDDLKMMALMLYDNYKARFGLTNSGVAAEVALLLNFNEKTPKVRVICTKLHILLHLTEQEYIKTPVGYVMYMYL